MCVGAPPPPRSCHQGTFTPAGSDGLVASPVLTDSAGLFKLDDMRPGLLAFAPGCSDNVAKASVKYWSVAPTVPGSNLTVTALSTLAEPLRRASCTAGGACKALGDASLVADVYALFGYQPQAGVNYNSWDGLVMGTKYGLSVYVLNQKVAAVLNAASETASRLCPGFDTSTSPSVQLAVQAALVRLLLDKPNAESCLAALASPTDVAAAMRYTLAALAAPEAGLQCVALSAADYNVLLPMLAKVRAQRWDTRQLQPGWQ